MNNPVFSIPCILALTAITLLLAAWSKDSQPADRQSNDSRGHADSTASKDTHGHSDDTAGASTVTGNKVCPEHNVPVAECGICNPKLLATLKTGEAAKVRLAAADSAALAGVQTAVPSQGTAADVVDCYAELSFNQNKLAQITAPVGGIIQDVLADLGNSIADQQVVAKIWSATIADAVAKAVLTHQTLERERKLHAERVSAEKDLQLAEAEHRAACQNARTLGFTEEDIDHMKGNPNDSVFLEMRAPFSGDIVERTAVRGALVEVGKPLFTLADRSVMWAMLNIPEAELANVKEGQAVELRLEALPGQVFTGKLTWISAEVDDKSRMARARADVPNPQRVLKAKMFAQARIITRKSEQALLLPASAIQRLDHKSVVFVQLANDLFDARIVHVGAQLDGVVEILGGLQPQEQVAIRHAFPLKSALLISRLGAGCADD